MDIKLEKYFIENLAPSLNYGEYNYGFEGTEASGGRWGAGLPPRCLVPTTPLPAVSLSPQNSEEDFPTPFHAAS